MKINFIPNWNGHLFLQESEDQSISYLYEKLNFQNKEIIKIKKNNIEETNKIIENKIIEDLTANKLILSITGDHSNTYPLVKGFSKKNKDFNLVIFDAHPDVEMTTDSISHEDYLRNLIENEIVEPKNIYLFGIRTFSRIEFEYLLKKKVNFWTISDILKNKNSIEEILSNLKNIYLSIDIDVLDPDDAPGTYYTEWCGLSIKELIKFIEILKPEIKSCDITEFYFEKDKHNITEKNVFKLIDKFIN